MVHRVRGRGGSSKREEECDVRRRLLLRPGRRRQLRRTSRSVGQGLGCGLQAVMVLAAMRDPTHRAGERRAERQVRQGAPAGGQRSPGRPAARQKSRLRVA